MAKTEFTIPKQNLDQLLAEVHGELNVILAKGAKDDEPAEESSGAAPGAPAEDLAPPEASAPPEAAPPAPEVSAPAPEATPAAPGAEASPGAPPSMEELVQAYAELPPDQFQMHLQALQVVAQQQGAGAAAPPAPPEAAAPMAPPPAAAPMMGKGEIAQVVKPSPGSGGMQKSEKAEIETLKAQLANQEAAMGRLVEALQTPLRKSIKGISEVEFVGKGHEDKALSDLSKAEVTQLLREKARDASLSKSDKDLIFGFYAKTIPLEKLSHLLLAAK